MAKNKEKLEFLRHSFAHVSMQALEKLYGAIPGVGPAIEDGFYHDFDCEHQVTKEDLKKIEKQMKKIIGQNLKIEKEEMTIPEARKLLKEKKYKYTLELLDELEKEGEKKVAFYKQGDFVNMCKGPHVESTGELNAKAFKLVKLAGVYWKGDEKNKMIQRVYGVAFEKPEDLKEYLKRQEEAEKRNHRKIGQEMELFKNFSEIGQGLPVWLPNGYAMRRALEDYMIDMERKYGYEHILTPVINKKELFETSGHLGFFDESMYSPIEIDNEVFYLKPMSCPAGMMAYKMKPRSYRELPIKMGELGNVYRYEQSGELHGLQRVRGFTQNDGHIFCTKDQLKDQFVEVLEMLEKFYKDLGFTNYRYRISLSDDKKDKYVGKKEDWFKAEKVIREVLKEKEVDFYEEKGEATFYGPKLDVQAINVFGKEDSISTIQVDFNLPERFDLTYIDKDKKKQRPFVIHRALIGSFERFFAFLIEYYAGKFPLWIAPVQVAVLPVSDKFNDYAEELRLKLADQRLRVKVFDEDESLGKRIRNAQKQKIPYMLVVGEKEMKAGAVAVRSRDEGELGVMKYGEFEGKVLQEIQRKTH
ncbi:MAG: threonine--tRNA ligase [Candidatus Moranbacteria bacterium]|nr:threonine--tRNA ligase [Candidatus Moranbacteria bacterium]